MSQASPFLRRLTAIALLVLTLGAAYGLLVAPLLARYADSAASIAQSRDLLARYQRLAAQAGALRNALDNAGQEEPALADYLPAASDTLAASELQTLMRRILEENGGELRSASVLPAREESGPRAVGLRFQITVAIRALPAVLYALEYAKPVLFIDNLDILGIDGGWRSEGAQRDSLTVYFDLYGYLPPAPAHGPA